MRTRITRSFCRGRSRDSSSSRMSRGPEVILRADADDGFRLGACCQRGQPDAGSKGIAEMDIRTSFRPLDYLLTAVLVALAVLIGIENVNAGADADVAHALDSHSALMIPVFVLATLPILWRRQHILGAIGVSFVVLTASLPAFGWVTRCGFALPLAFAMAYAVARFAGSRQNQVLGLIGIVALEIVTLVQDSSTGALPALGLALPLTALAYGLGLFVESRAGRTVGAPTLPVEHAHA